MTWQDCPVLVTGAGGFIGSHLVERLVAKGARVRAFVHYRSTGSAGWLDQSTVSHDIQIVAGDLRDRDCVRRGVEGCRVVFHLGALIAIPYSYEAPLSYLQTNVEGTLNVLQAAREHGIDRVVHTSTSEVYGTAQRVPIDETHPLQGQSPYSASKIGADKMAEAFHRSYGTPIVTVRPFNTFGPRQSMRAIIPTLIAQALSGGPLRLGNIRPTRDFTFVEDTVAGFLLAAACDAAVGETINIGNGREIAIGELARLISTLCDADSCIEREEQRIRPGGSEVERLCADNQKARTMLAWRPTVSLEDGLRRTITWIASNSGLYRPHVYAV